MKKYFLKNTIYICLIFIITSKLYSQNFIEQTGIVLPALQNGRVDWGDYNNDGYLDILMAGTDDDRLQIGKVIKNNGDNTFSEQVGIFSPAIPADYTSYQICAEWADFNNDGYLDIMYCGYSSTGSNQVMIYQNGGDNTFTLITKIDYVSYYNKSATAGDFDNDGKIDILFTKNAETVVYLNLGNFEFIKQSKIILPGFKDSYSEFIDFDNDGDQDILLTGGIPSSATQLYENQGDGNFELLNNTPFIGVRNGSTSWADYNNDGFPDMLLTGSYPSKIYSNNGDGTFSELNSSNLSYIVDGQGKWGDVDNDGDYDIVMAGAGSSDVYINNGDSTFTIAAGTTIALLSTTSLDLGDYDNDGDLDLIIAGYEGPTSFCKVYMNDLVATNAPPDAPTGLSSTSTGQDLILSWDPVLDDNSESASLSYNVMIGTSSGNDDIVNPVSSPSGFFRSSGMGNAQMDTTFVVRNIPKGTYYWKVQSIDNSYKGGSFSSESSFTYSASCQASGLTAPYIGGSEASITWNRGNEDHCIVFMKKTNAGMPVPLNNTTYTASAEFGSGSQIGTSEWYCVYNGDQNTVHVTGLDPLSDYTLQVMEYSGTAGSEVYNNLVSQNNSLLLKTGSFTELFNAHLEAVNGSSTGGVQTTYCYWLDFDNDDDLDIFYMGAYGNLLYRNDGADIFTKVSFSNNLGKIAACADFDNDGFIDITLASSTSTKIYKGDGTTFSEVTGTNIPGFRSGYLDWGDYDNDGDLDLLLTGELGGSRETITKIYKNNDDHSLTEVNNHGVVSVRYGCTDWGDYDNDGDLDIAISGITIEGAYKTHLYKNQGNGTFILAQELAEAIGTVEWGDYNTDGFLDLLLITTGTNKLFANDGSGSLILQDQIDLSASYSSEGHWGDYDDDGDLDIIVSGYYSTAVYIPYTSIYRNMGNNSFEVDTTCNIVPAGFSPSAWGDYDNDGDIDLLFLGTSNDSGFAKIYRNDIGGSNVKPDAVIGLNSQVNKSEAHLSWNSIRSDNTAYPAMMYNLKVGTSSGSIDIVSPHSSSGGYLRLPELPNGNLDTTFLLANLPIGNYYWSVQAVDNSFKGGTFSAEESFSIVPVQSTNLTANIINSNSLQLKWERGNGSRCIVLCKETNTGLSAPVDNESYLPDSEFGFGEQLGTSGWYCVYNGRSDSVIVTGLTYKVDYSFHVIEYLGEIGSEQYFTDVVTGNPGVFSTGLFSEQTDISLSNPEFNDYSWGDYNNDGYTDILIPGDYSKILVNNGDNSFAELSTALFPNTIHGTGSWVDYDNDGDLDVFLSGSMDYTFTSHASNLYRNEGAGNYTLETSAIFDDVYYSAADWGDFDNDGDIDLLLLGATGEDPNFNPITKIYSNNGDGSFTEQTQINLPGLYLGSARWVDYDNDGDVDIHISGLQDYSTSSNISKIYKNNGDQTFTEQTFNLPGLRNSRVDWGDFDHDGDLDLAMTKPGYIFVYENLGESFSNIIDTFIPYSSDGAILWGDYDNDGFLDILFGNFSSAAMIYRNINGENFEIIDDGSFKFTSVQGMKWCDYDNDGDIDISVHSWGGDIKLYKNNRYMESGLFPVNNSASAPDGLVVKSTPGGVTMNWNPVSTDESPSASLSYNVKIGTVPDTANICPPHSDTTGFRQIARQGNASVDSSYLIKGLEPGKYFWSVQAIDQAYKGGKWAATDSFDVKSLLAFFAFDTVCNGLETTFIDQSISTDVITTWNWDFGDGGISSEQNPTYIFTSSGTHNVKLVIQSAGFSDSLIQEVFVMPRPEASFTAENVCQGDFTTYVNTTNSAGSTIAEWHWDFDDGFSSSLENPDDHGYINTGDYYVKLSAYATNGCSDSSTNVVSVAEIPVSDIATGSSTEFCAGKNVKLSVPQNAIFDYQWKIGGVPIAGADSSVYYATSTGLYTVSIFNSIGSCTSESLEAVPVDVTNSPAQPYIQNTGSDIFCEGDTVLLSVTDNPALDYQWKLNGGAIGSDSSIIKAIFEGSYTLDVTNSSGCTASASNPITLTMNPSPANQTINQIGGTTICSGDTVELSVTNDPDLSYQWMNYNSIPSEGTSNIYYVTSSGSYRLVMENDLGCKKTTLPVIIDVNQSPDVPILNTDVNKLTFCEGDSVAISTTYNSELTYHWKRDGMDVGSNISYLIAKSSGLYSLEVINALACTSVSTESFAILVNPVPNKPSISKNGDTIFCEGGKVNLNVNSEAGMTYQWMNGEITLEDATTKSYEATSSGNYSVVITNANECSTETDPQNVSVRPTPVPPTIIYNGDLELCEGGELELSVTSEPGTGYKWLFNNIVVDSLSTYYYAKETGTYSLRATNSSACSENSTNTVALTVLALPPKPSVQIGGDGLKNLCEGESAVLSVSSTIAYNTYQWLDNGFPMSNEEFNSIEVNESGSYAVLVSNNSQCENISDETEITITRNPRPVNIQAENYEENACPSEEPIILKVGETESDVSYKWQRYTTVLDNETNSTLEGFLSEGDYIVTASRGICTSISEPFSIKYGDMPNKPKIIAEGPVVWYLVCSDTTATDYRWYLNGELIPGADKNLYVANRDYGMYEVSISEGGCYTKSDPIGIPFTGVENNPWEHLKIYPNPTPGLFTLEMDNPIMGELIINIMNESGSQMLNIKFLKEMSHFQTQIDLSGQPAAVYIIGLMLEEYKASRRLIVE